MLANQLAIKYAQAMYELAAEKDMLDSVEQQLQLVEATIAGHEDMATLMYHPRVPGSVKKDTINKVFGNELAEFVRNFLFVVIDKRRETALPVIITEYVRLANEARNIVEAEVTTAKPLTGAEAQALSAKLSTVTGKNVIIKTAINANMLGGVIVKIGDKLIDGSVVRQLDMLKRALFKLEVTKIGVTD